MSFSLPLRVSGLCPSSYRYQVSVLLVTFTRCGKTASGFTAVSACCATSIFSIASGDDRARAGTRLFRSAVSQAPLMTPEKQDCHSEGIRRRCPKNLKTPTKPPQYAIESFVPSLSRRPRGRSLAAGRYNNTLLNCFPGICRTIPFISRSKRVARTSEEFKPDRSTMSSICTASSEFNNS